MKMIEHFGAGVHGFGCREGSELQESFDAGQYLLPTRP
jgi:hypothetical protein